MHADGLAEIAELAAGSGQRVADAYGSLASGPVGHARAPDRIPRATLQELGIYVDQLHSHGIRFHYTINAPWINGAERSDPGRSRIGSHLQSLADAGVDALVVANPYLLRLVRDWFPGIGIVASINFRAACSEAVGRLLALGADRVVLDRSVNRDMPLLRAVCAQCGPKVELLANSTCLADCPFQTYHAIETGCRSTEGQGALCVKDPDACHEYCLDAILDAPASVLRATWIRPEDLPRYEALGVRAVKIQGRTLGPCEQLALVRAYVLGQTPGGDLFNLFPGLRDSLARRAERHPGQDGRWVGGVCLSVGALERDGFFSYLETHGHACRLGCATCGRCEQTMERLLAEGGPGTFTTGSERPVPA
jgi:collagenase-like PrtC family protease